MRYSLVSLQSQATRTLAAVALLAVCAAPALAVEYVSSVVASGLNSPRGLNFDPYGALWVTEAGAPVGGTAPIFTLRGNTFTYTETGSVSRIFGGTQARVFTGLPTFYNIATGAMEMGPNDIAFRPNGTLAIAISGGGLDPARRFTDLAPVGYQLGRVITLGGAVDVAAHETAYNPDGGELASNPWNLAALSDGSTLVTDAAANALLKIAGDGSVSTVAVFGPRALGGPRPTEAVPTGLAVGPDGAYYVGELTGFPFVPGAARVERVESNGSKSVFADGFTMVTDIAFDAHGNLFVLEYDTNGLLQPGSQGRLWEVAADGTKSVVWTEGLVNPTGLAIGKDGSFYIANYSDNGAGAGQVLRISAVPEPGTVGLMLAGLGLVGFIGRRRRSA